MRFMKAAGAIPVLVAVAVMCFYPVPAAAQTFPAGPNDDVTSSLGMFRIWVLPQWRAMTTGCTGYNPATFRWDSPTLLDPNTRVGRSDPGTDADPLDTGGRPTGLAAPVVVKDSDFTVYPPWWRFEVPGTNELHTNVSDLNMGPVMGFGVRAGVSAPGRPDSPGEVSSKELGGGANDFPAASFFNIYVEVDVPACGGFATPQVFFNAHALLVGDTNLVYQPPTGLPPKVIYTHQNSQAVPVYFLGGPYHLQLYGFLVLAGHGMSYGQGEEADFEDFMSQVEEMEIPQIPTVTPWGIAVLVALLLITATWLLVRRKRAEA